MCHDEKKYSLGKWENNLHRVPNLRMLLELKPDIACSDHFDFGGLIFLKLKLGFAYLWVNHIFRLIAFQEGVVRPSMMDSSSNIGYYVSPLISD